MRQIRMSKARILLAAAGGALSAGVLHAAPERYWNNFFGGSFISSANWTSPDPGDPIPGAQNYAIFNLASTYTVNLTANKTVNQLMGRLGHPTLNLGGFTMTTNNVWVADEDGVQAQYTLSNGRVNSDGGFIGSNFSSIGTLHQTGTMQWSMTDDLSVGEFGTGVFNMQPGAICTAFGFFIGTGTTGVGTINVDGGNTFMSASGDYFVGYFGSGTLNITGGADVITPQLNVATIANSTGVINVDGAGSTLSGGVTLWNIGNSGDGAVNITNGGIVSSANAQLAAGSGAYGECLISGAGSRWISSGSFYPGRSGDGYLVIESDGNLNAASSIVLGLDPSGYGDVTVRTGGTMVTGSQLQVAREGDAVMRVEAQSSVTSSGQGSPTFTSGYIGGLAGSNGSMTISGANARWNADNGSAVIGFAGQGQLSITAAGQLNSAGGFIGRNPGSVGAVTISGNSAKWTSTGGVSVGLGPSNAAGGSGILTVNGQGRIFAPIINVGASGTVAGTGMIEAPISNGGVVAPGTGPGDAGTLTVAGAYTQTSAGDLAIEIGSSEFDALSVSGAATLAGDLVVTLLGSPNPPDGTVYDIITAGSISGTFTAVTVPSLPDGRTLSVSYTGTKVRLTVGPGGASCPEDVDNDGMVGFSDLNIVISQFNTSGPNLQGDVNDDGFVNFADLNAVVSVFNTVCPS